MRVLIVEDEFLVAMALEVALTDAGYDVGLARDGVEALAMIEHGEVDAVLTDILMPRMNGYQLIDALRTRWPGLPVVAMTGYARTEEGDSLARIEDTGITVLGKPVDMDRVVDTLREVLGS